MRRSGRKAPIEPVGLYPPTDQGTYIRQMSKEERYKAAKHGWRNWYINRGRLLLEGDRKLERQISWRRVH
jgi:hypothetical protein